MARFLFVLLCALSTQLVYARDSNGDFSIRGAGLLDCQSFLNARDQESPAYAMIGGWLDGYLTGSNQYRPGTYDATSFQGTELLLKIIDAHCRNHTQDRLYTVINSLLYKISPERINEKSEQVAIEVGTARTLLYKEVILRLQKRLHDAGLLKQLPDGKYNAATLSAVAAYQKTLDFEPTGFPDQATLWHLFSE